MTSPEVPDRDAALDEIARRYAWYETSGHAARWTAGGMPLAVAERDAWILRALGNVTKQTILDVGCGEGTVALILSRADLRPSALLGIDLLPDRVAQARRNVPWGRFEVGSADAMTFGAEVADTAVAMTLFSSLPTASLRSGVAAEVGRVLRPGGALVVYDIRYPSPRNRAIRPVSVRELRALFPGWELRARTLTLLPPLARSRLAAGRRRYRALAAIPFLRSHLGVVLVKPG